MSYKLIDGRAHAKALRTEIGKHVTVLQELGWSQKLVSIDVGGIHAIQLYMRNQQRACIEVGIAFEQRSYPAEVSQRELLAAIQALNVDPRVTGIIMQRPLPPHLDLKYLQNAIHPDKDVEGMNAANIGNIVYGGSTLGPCTARASVALLKTTGLSLRGLEVVVVGHSEIVGKPIALRTDGGVRHRHHLPPRDAQPGDSHAARGGALRGGRQAGADPRGHGEARCGGDRYRNQSARRWEDRRRRGLRQRGGRGGLDHAGPRRRRPDDGGDPAEEHDAGRRAPAPQLRGRRWPPPSPSKAVRAAQTENLLPKSEPPKRSRPRSEDSSFPKGRTLGGVAAGLAARSAR